MFGACPEILDRHAASTWSASCSGKAPLTRRLRCTKAPTVGTQAAQDTRTVAISGVGISATAASGGADASSYELIPCRRLPAGWRRGKAGIGIKDRRTQRLQPR